MAGVRMSLIGNCPKHPLTTEGVVSNRETARILVEELMGKVAEQDSIFAHYKVLLPGSTKENLKVSNPFEIDYLISYDIALEDIIEDKQHIGYVMLVPKEDACVKFKSVLLSKKLSSDKLLFLFLKLVYAITTERIYRNKPSYLSLVLHTSDQVLNIHNFRFTGIGAALTFQILSTDLRIDIKEHIDVVLAFSCNGYWPDCAKGWKKKNSISKKCFNKVMMHGISAIPKEPDKSLHGPLPTLFRLSFSFAESQIICYLSSEQKEAYRILKVMHEIEFTDLLLGICFH